MRKRISGDVTGNGKPKSETESQSKDESPENDDESVDSSGPKCSNCEKDSDQGDAHSVNGAVRKKHANSNSSASSSDEEDC